MQTNKNFITTVGILELVNLNTHFLEILHEISTMLVSFSGAALLVFGVTLIVRAIQFGKLVH